MGENLTSRIDRIEHYAGDFGIGRGRLSQMAGVGQDWSGFGHLEVLALEDALRQWACRMFSRLARVQAGKNLPVSGWPASPKEIEDERAGRRMESHQRRLQRAEEAKAQRQAGAAASKPFHIRLYPNAAYAAGRMDVVVVHPMLTDADRQKFLPAETEGNAEAMVRHFLARCAGEFAQNAEADGDEGRAGFWRRFDIAGAELRLRVNKVPLAFNKFAPVRQNA